MKKLLKIITEKQDDIFLVDVSSGKEIFYRDIVQKTMAIYSELKEDIHQGDCIAVMLKTPELYIPSILACWQAGAIPVMFDPMTPLKRLDIYNSIVSPVAVLSDTNDITFPKNKGIVNIGNLSSSAGDACCELTFCMDEFSQPAIILFSSGTTGIPKCIPLSYSNISNNVDAFSKLLGIGRDDTFLCTSPLWYAHGLYNSFLTALILGTKVIYGGILNITNAQKILDAGYEYNASIFHITPSMLPILCLIGSRSKRPLPDFRYVICGTAKLNKKDKEKFEAVFKVDVTQQYGMSEVLFITVNYSKQKELPDSVGVPVGCELKICDDGGNEVPFDEIGNINVRSESAFGSYYSQKDVTEAAYSGGWFKTGDLGALNKDQFLTIHGRSNEIIKKGGIAISPDEIDAAFLKHESVLDVATVGKNDDIYGQEIYTFVVVSKNTSEASLVQHLSAYLPATHTPRRIIFLDMLPKTTSGKTNKYELGSYL